MESGSCSQCSDYLWTGWSGVQISAGAIDFLFSRTNQTNSVAHLASYSMSIGSSFLRVKQPGHAVNHSPLSSSAELRISGAIALLMRYAFGGWTGRALPFIVVQKDLGFEAQPVECMYNNAL
jgi:hypothetical protein